MKNYWSRRELEALGEPINPKAPSRLDGRVGGGGKSSPAVPDYTAAAEATAKSNAEAMKQQTVANRPNIVTPYGNQTWTNDRSFDQAGYDNAMSQYNTQQSQAASQPSEYDDNPFGFGQLLKNQNQASSMAAPDRNSFYGDDNWTQTTTLSPESQKALDSQMEIQQGRSDTALGLMPQVNEAVNTPIDKSKLQDWGAAPTTSNFQNMGAAPTLQTQLDTSQVPSMPGDSNSEYVQQYVDKANEYARPQNELDQSNMDAKLYNMGLTPGSSAFNNAQRSLADQRSRNEFNAINTGMNQSNQMYMNQLAANNQGFNQSLASGQFGNNAMKDQNAMNMGNAGFNNGNANTSFNQEMAQSNYANTLRQGQWTMAQQEQLQPLNNLNALLNGQQVSMPNMPSFMGAGNSGGVNYSGAVNNQYQADLANSNAQNAGSAGLMSGLFSMGGMALGGPMGGALGKAMTG
mgnify:FL=1|jgi:hypothetical protein